MQQAVTLSQSITLLCASHYASEQHLPFLTSSSGSSGACSSSDSSEDSSSSSPDSASGWGISRSLMLILVTTKSPWMFRSRLVRGLGGMKVRYWGSATSSVLSVSAGYCWPTLATDEPPISTSSSSAPSSSSSAQLRLETFFCSSVEVLLASAIFNNF